MPGKAGGSTDGHRGDPDCLTLYTGEGNKAKTAKEGGIRIRGKRRKPVSSQYRAINQSIDIVSGGESGKEPAESGGITTGIRGRITGGKSVAGHTQAGKGGLSKARIGLEVIYS